MTKKMYASVTMILAGLVAIVAVAFYGFNLNNDLQLGEPVLRFLNLTREDMRDGYAELGLDFAETVSYENFQGGLLDNDFQSYDRYELISLRTGEDFGRPNEAHVVAEIYGEDVETKRMEFLLVKTGDDWKVVAFGFSQPAELEATVIEVE